MCYEREGFECTLHMAVFFFQPAAEQWNTELSAPRYHVLSIFLNCSFGIFAFFFFFFLGHLNESTPVSLFNRRLQHTSSLIQLQMDAFILILFLIFLVESVPWFYPS